MNISISRVITIAQFKFKELTKNKTFLIALAVIPGMTLVMRWLYTSMGEEFGEEMPPEIFGMVLAMGVLYVLTMLSISMPATLLSKDKEKHTLRALMTSSVSGGEYFLGSILPLLLIGIILNGVVLVISGLDMNMVNIPVFFLLTTLGIVTGNVLGMTIGIFAKDQMAAGNMATPFLLILMLIPMFSMLLESLAQISQYIYTGIVVDMIFNYSAGVAFILTPFKLGVMLVEIAAAIALFLFVYKRNGFEQD
ncbi:MAG: ABC transporter permease [Erysipelotrichaceae bacterium]|jgi:ABC-2 type transport system permease protein|nr:ABC transporter permease [Erysipelotrichaceae bacterium]